VRTGEILWQHPTLHGQDVFIIDSRDDIAGKQVVIQDRHYRVIDADTAAWGGRGLESAGAPTWFFPIWDTVGDWSTKAVEARNWLDVLLEDTVAHVKDVRLEPDSMTLKPGETREIKPVFTPENATRKTGTWKVNSAGVHNVCWIEPEMKDEINPSVVKPEYSREGKIMVHAGMPHGAPKATITFITTDGKHTATCKVKLK